MVTSITSLWVGGSKKQRAASLPTSLVATVGKALSAEGPEGLRVTPLGGRLIPLAEEVERAVSAVRDLAASQKGRVRLAVPLGLTRLFMAGLAKLCTDHPGLSLELVSGS